MSVRRETMTGLERARRRRRNRAIAVLVLAGVLVLGGFGMALAYWSGWVGVSDEAPACTPTTATLAQAKFTVNVYNSSDRSGAADGLSESLRSRGFNLGTVGNDPYKKKLGSTAGEIRYGSEGEDLAKRHLLPLLPDAKLVEDGRTGTSVDVAIGGLTSSVPTGTATPTTFGC